MTNRWHNMLGSFADWDKIHTEVETLHKNAEAAGFDLKIVDEQCPCCGFRPAVQMNERRQKRAKRQPEQPSFEFDRDK
jgi:predicted Zn-ribbon and HTH transcriptional regulator